MAWGLRMCGCGMHLFSWWGRVGPPPCPEPPADLLQGLAVVWRDLGLSRAPAPRPATGGFVACSHSLLLAPPTQTPGGSRGCMCTCKSCVPSDPLRRPSLASSASHHVSLTCLRVRATLGRRQLLQDSQLRTHRMARRRRERRLLVFANLL